MYTLHNWQSLATCGYIPPLMSHANTWYPINPECDDKDKNTGILASRGEAYVVTRETGYLPQRQRQTQTQTQTQTQGKNTGILASRGEAYVVQCNTGDGISSHYISYPRRYPPHG